MVERSCGIQHFHVCSPSRSCASLALVVVFCLSDGPHGAQIVQWGGEDPGKKKATLPFNPPLLLTALFVSTYVSLDLDPVLFFAFCRLNAIHLMPRYTLSLSRKERALSFFLPLSGSHSSLLTLS